MASRGDSPTLFAGQPWSAYYESVAGNRGEEAKDASQQPEVEAASEGGSMKLRKDDIKIFGVCPSLDEFYLTVCDYCGAVIKPQALMGHIEVRHKGSTNDFKPLEHLATNKEPLLKPPHKNKAKLNDRVTDKVPPQNPMAKYGLPKAPPKYHPNGKPKTALVEQLNKAHPASLVKSSSGGSSGSGGGMAAATAAAAATTVQLSAASRKLLPPQPPPPPSPPVASSSTSLLPPPPPQPPPPERRPEPPACQAAAVQQQQPAPVTVHSGVVSANQRDEARHLLREPALPRINAAAVSSAASSPSLAALSIPAASTPAVAVVPPTAGALPPPQAAAACLEPSGPPPAAASRTESAAGLVMPLDSSSKSISDVRRGSSGVAAGKPRDGSSACLAARVDPPSAGSRGNTGSASGSSAMAFVGNESGARNFAASAAACAPAPSSRPAAAAPTAAGKVTELAAPDDSRRGAAAPEAVCGTGGVCLAVDDSRGCKRSPGSLSPPPFKKPCRLGSAPGSSTAVRLLPCKDREYDPDKHCGVFIDDVHKNCTRSLTCKTHALSLRRKVPGRTKPFDQLLKEHREAKEATLQSKLKGVSPPPPHQSGRVYRTSPALSLSSHSPRSSTGSCDQAVPEIAAAARLSIGTDSGSGSCTGLPLYRQASLPDGYLTHHPRPLAVNSFGVRLNGCTFVLNRKADLLRTAVQATLDQRQLHLLHPARKLSHTKGSGSGAKDLGSSGPAATNAAAAADGPLSGPVLARTPTSLPGAVQSVLVPTGPVVVGGKAAMVSPALRSAPGGGGGGLPLSLACGSTATGSLDGPAAKRHKSGDLPAVATTMATTMTNALQSLQGSSQHAAGLAAAQQLLAGGGGSGLGPAGGIPASRPLLATLAARQQQQQLLLQQQQDTAGSGAVAASSATPAMTATLLALGGTSAAGGLVRFGSQTAPPSIGSLGSVPSAAGRGTAGSVPGTAAALLVTDIPMSAIDKSGGTAVSAVGPSPTTFLLTSCGAAENARLKGGLVNGSIQMTTNTSSIGALTSRGTSGAAAVASTLLASSPSAADGSTTLGMALTSTCLPSALFRKPEAINALATNCAVAATAAPMSGSTVTGIQLSAIAGQRHLAISSSAASQPAASIGALLGSGSTLMAGQSHILQQQQQQQSGMSAGGYPLHISSSSLKSLPQHSIRLVNASQPHQTLRQQQLSPAVSLTIPLVANVPQQPQPQQQQQSAVHKAAAAQSSMSNLRV